MICKASETFSALFAPTYWRRMRIFVLATLYLQSVEEKWLQQVMPQVKRFIQQARTHTTPVLADGVAAQQVTHRVPDGGQTLHTLHIYEQAAHTAAHVLFTPDTQTHTHK